MTPEEIEKEVMEMFPKEIRERHCAGYKRHKEELRRMLREQLNEQAAKEDRSRQADKESETV